MEPENKTPRREPPTTRALAELLQSREFVQDGPEVKYDDYGRPTNVKAIECYKSNNAFIMLSAIYNDWERTSQERVEAGEALGYNSIRVWLHERTGVVRAAISRVGRRTKNRYENLIFDRGRALIDSQN